MRALLLAPFSEQAIAELVAAGVEVVHEDWLQTGTLQDPEELGARISRDGIGAVVVEGDFLFAETFDLAPELGFAGICRAAVNQVDVEAATERGVVVVNTPGRNAAAVAELTLGLCSLSRAAFRSRTGTCVRARGSLPQGHTGNSAGVNLPGS